MAHQIPVICPELAPQGKNLTIAFSVPKYSTGALRSLDAINMALLNLQENFHSFQKCGEIIHIGTYHKDWPTEHRWVEYQMPIRTSIENVYNAGEGCMSPGMIGVEGCAYSAKNVGNDIHQISLIWKLLKNSKVALPFN